MVETTQQFSEVISPPNLPTQKEPEYFLSLAKEPEATYWAGLSRFICYVFA
jgi:hypothetical protein